MIANARDLEPLGQLAYPAPLFSSKMPLRTLRKLCLALAALLAGAAPAAAQRGGPELHFRAPPPQGVAVGAALLSAEERAYLAALPEVRVALAKPAFRPYEVIGENGEVSGLHAEMLAHLARAFGFRVRPVVFENWSEVLEAARLREVDVLMSVGVTAARAEFLEFTLGATPMVSALFARQQHASALEAARFAITRNNIAGEYVNRHHPRATLRGYEGADAALAALAQGEVDYFVANLLPTLDRIEQGRLTGIEVRQLVQYGSGHFHFAVRKDWAPLARILNKGIAALRQEPPAALSAAMAALPGAAASAALTPTKALTPGQRAVLVERPVWRVGAVRGLALLNDVAQGERHTGIAAEYTELVARRLGIGLQLVAFDSVGTMLDAMRAGQIDVVPFLTQTTQRAREFSFSKPYVEMPYMIVARNDAPLYWNLGSLRGRRLALAPQHPIRELLAEHYPDIVVLDVPGGQGAMDAVARRAADAAVEVKFFANLRIHTDNDGLLRTVAAVEELPAQFHFATSRAARALLPLIDEVLAEIPELERERMLRRWVAQDLTPAFPWRRHLGAMVAGAAALVLLAGLTLWWMARLQREAQARRRSEKLLEDIAATAPGIAYRYRQQADGGMTQVFMAPQAASFFGIELDTQRSLLANLAPHLATESMAVPPAALLTEEQQCLEEGRPFRATLPYRNRAATSVRWLHLEALPGRDEAGQPLWTGNVVDISTQHALQQQVARDAEARNLMLASTSHELRAPTHNLSLALQSIDADTLPAPAARAIGIARRAARTLTQLLTDVLDAARLQHAPLKLEVAPFAPRELARELAEAWSAAAADKGLTFSFDVGANVPATWAGDALRVRQVLTNLLSNACKYTEAGRIGLEVRCDA